ncbi:hypothetical protein BDZ45DRAFT_756063 [Acephala macrosclerotiorum]|nr:hypothetical protein BDZ45DRAFT_756063 [Acephala macrosclerotiorum]
MGDTVGSTIWLGQQTPDERRVEYEEMRFAQREQKRIAEKYPDLANEAGVAPLLLGLVDEVNNHYEEHGNVYIVDSLRGVAGRMYLSKHSSVSVVLTREFFRRRVKGKSKAVTQYTVIDFAARERTPWRPIDEGADRGEIPEGAVIYTSDSTTVKVPSVDHPAGDSASETESNDTQMADASSELSTSPPDSILVIEIPNYIHNEEAAIPQAENHNNEDEDAKSKSSTPTVSENDSVFVPSRSPSPYSPLRSPNARVPLSFPTIIEDY